MADNVNHPSHYTQGGIECIDGIKASMTAETFRGCLKGNVLKYVWRYEKKEKPVEDLKKARWYLDRLIQELEDSNKIKEVEQVEEKASAKNISFEEFKKDFINLRAYICSYSENYKEVHCSGWLKASSFQWENIYVIIGSYSKSDEEKIVDKLLHDDFVSDSYEQYKETFHECLEAEAEKISLKKSKDITMEEFKNITTVTQANLYGGDYYFTCFLKEDNTPTIFAERIHIRNPSPKKEEEAMNRFYNRAYKEYLDMLEEEIIDSYF